MFSRQVLKPPRIALAGWPYLGYYDRQFSPVVIYENDKPLPLPHARPDAIENIGLGNPDPDRGSEGLCWGVGHDEAFASSRGDASNVREALAPMMPKAGEDRVSVSDVFGNVHAQCLQLLAGRAAERMLLEGEPAMPADDLRQARELAMLICSSEEAIETFIAHCDVAARDMLLPCGDVVMTLSIVLRIRRTLDGPEIDKIISDLQARKAQAPSVFTWSHHPNAARPSHFAPDRLG